MSYHYHIWIHLTVILFLPRSVLAGTVNNSFLVSAMISTGCVFGRSDSGNNFGTINFGERSDINTNVDVASTTDTGSLIVTCTPGTSINIALDYGLNGRNGNRYLVNLQGTRMLAYQLYKDASYSQIWGTGTLASNTVVFPAAPQRTYTVYARLFASSSRPPAGSYTDVVTVTLTY